MDPGAFDGQRHGRKTLRGPPWQCTASVCSGSALLGDIVVSRSMEHDHLSVLSICPRIFLCVFSVYRLLVGFLFCDIVFYYMFMCVSCFGLVVSTCQVIG